jgi:uncharacterized protein (TIGR04255 family)
MGRRLKNPPLVEALVELKWQLQKAESGAAGPEAVLDPGYPLYIGRLQDLLRAEYPFVERLPAAQIPDEITPHVPKYRFRRAMDGWPVVQAGPGLLSVHFTESYTWDTFLAAARATLERFLRAYPSEGSISPPRMINVVLRYINAVSEHTGYSPSLDWLSRKMHINVAVPAKLVTCGPMGAETRAYRVQLDYPLSAPRGVGAICLGTGTSRGQPSTIAEVFVLSTAADAPTDAPAFEKWLVAAHEVVERWFFAMIEGDLEKAFEA